jgi:hypothetical protein
MVGVIVAGAGEAEPLLEGVVDAVVLAGPSGLAPASRPLPAGAMYVVAETFAEICGNPFGPAPSEIPLMVSRRPLTVIVPLLATTKRSSRLKKSDMWKKLPVKLKLNCSVGKPAGPTEAPGGSTAAAAAAALAALEELDEFTALPTDEVDGVVDGVGVGAGDPLELPGVICRLRKSTFAALAAVWIW